MEQAAQSIELNLSEKLRDPKYRRKFFLAESSALIAQQLIALRKKRALSQKQLAEVAGTKQPAISRAEQADYQNWSFSTLRSIAEALDARIRVLIQPSEDVLKEYEPAQNIFDSVTLELTESQYKASENVYVIFAMNSAYPAKMDAVTSGGLLDQKMPRAMPGWSPLVPASQDNPYKLQSENYATPVYIGQPKIGIM